MDKREVSASITVYLTLVLLLVLSLVTVTLEAALTAGGRFMAESISRLAADSVLGGYHTGLYERYHIFGLPSEDISNSLVKYARENLDYGGAFLWKLDVMGATVDETAALTDYRGELFRKQAVEYMEFKGVSLVVERLLDSIDLFEKADKTTGVLNAKAETEEEVAKIDECVLELFELVDGLRCDGTGIKQSFTGKIKVAGSFAKKLFIGTPTQESMKVNHPDLFAALSEHYTNPLLLLNTIEEEGNRYLFYLKEIAFLEEQIEMLMRGEADFIAARETAKEAENGDTAAGTKTGTAATGEEKTESPKLLEMIAFRLEAEAKKMEYAVCSVDAYFRYELARNELQNLLNGCRKTTEDALSTIAEIEVRQKVAQSKVWEYEGILTSAAEWMDAEFGQELNQGLGLMKEYVGEDVEGKERILDFSKCGETLEHNRVILNRVVNQDLSVPMPDTENTWKEAVQILRYQFPEYSHEGLEFDYSKMKLKASGQSPMESLSSLIKGGVGGLILGDLPVSEKWFGIMDLPSFGKDSEQSDEGAEDLLSAFDQGSPLQGIQELAAEGISALGEKLLFLTYLTDHFSDFRSGASGDTVLEYELEYILCGKTADTENLSSFLFRILLVRLLFCLIHVLSDSEKTNKAQGLATGLLGFTGLPMLISVMKYLILFLWAAEGAMVETAAIIRGKKVAVLPTKTNFPVQFEEMLFMSKPLIQSKAENRKDDTGIRLGYQEYLLFFLLLQKEELQNYRAMDLIQINLAAVQEDFRMKNMLYGINLTLEYDMPSVFTQMFAIRQRGDKKHRYRVPCGAVY